MKRMLGLLALSATALVLVGCNTIKGMGTDISDGGKAISHSAERHGAS